MPHFSIIVKLIRFLTRFLILFYSIDKIIYECGICPFILSIASFTFCQNVFDELLWIFRFNDAELY
jgi:hypothetical protein